MKETKTKGIKPYARPVIVRYEMTEGQVAEYNIATGGSNILKCNDRECGGGGASLQMPAWMEP